MMGFIQGVQNHFVLKNQFTKLGHNSVEKHIGFILVHLNSWATSSSSSRLRLLLIKTLITAKYSLCHF